MRRLVIAIDCDDVLVPSTEQLVALYNQQHGVSVPLEKASSFEWQANLETTSERIYDIQLTKEYGLTPPFEQAIIACKRLAKYHELHLVTARPEKVMRVTHKMLDEYFPDIFQIIEHIGNSGNKGEICQKLQADVLIDDNYRHIMTASECGVPGLIWFGDYPWQRGEKNTQAREVVHCVDWPSVEKEIEPYFP